MKENMQDELDDEIEAEDAPTAALDSDRGGAAANGSASGRSSDAEPSGGEHESEVQPRGGGSPAVSPTFSLPAIRRTSAEEETTDARFRVIMKSELPSQYIYDPTSDLICTRSIAARGTPICGPIRLERLMRSPDGTRGWALQLRLIDRDGSERNHVADAALLSQSPREISTELLQAGFDIRARPSMFVQFLQSLQTGRRGWSTRRADRFHLGLPDGRGFVLPTGEVLSKPNLTVLPVTALGSAPSEASRAGSLAGWRLGVGRLLRGNPVLIFAVGFSGPILHLAQIDNLGFNPFGRTSSSKTQALRRARCSIACHRASPRRGPGHIGCAWRRSI